MNSKLLALGTMAFDAIETPFGKTGKILGGCATYIGLAASQFKVDCGLVSVVGEDFDESHISLLKSKGLDLTGVEIIKGEKTFFWSGKYHNDLNSRTTLDTQLNVLTKFKPIVPDHYKDASMVLLGNLDPNLQLAVLEQLEQPSLVVMDTMNFWIEGYREKLDEVIAKVDVLSINDEEARQISGTHSLVEAAKIIQAMGPDFVIIKKGEHGALLFHGNQIFCVPGLPLEEVFDPTGAGDSFIGGFIGFLTQYQTLSFEAMKSAMVVGSAMASFTVQQFGTEALASLTPKQLHQRIEAFKALTEFEIEIT
ncbi:MAG: PfkB family carbohydrate kinase [Flavobacteriaceae bacterium]